MWEKLVELDLFNPNKKIGIKKATPAQALQRILTEVWSLSSNDKDMVVMYHKLRYEKDNKKYEVMLH